jgi:hypothetical protein
VISKYNAAVTNVAYAMDFRPTVTGSGSCSSGCFLSLVTWDSVSVPGVLSTTDFNSASNVGKWFHAVGVINGTTYQLYINGVLQSSATGSFGIQSNTGHVSIGAALVPSAARFFPGTMDDMRIYNRALSAQEIKQLYAMSH